MRIAPWGVILLVLYGLVCTLLGARCLVDDLRARRATRTMTALSDTLRVTLDSIRNAPYHVDTLRARHR